jgi:hypothetical protein
MRPWMPSNNWYQGPFDNQGYNVVYNSGRRGSLTESNRMSIKDRIGQASMIASTKPRVNNTKPIVNINKPVVNNKPIRNNTIVNNKPIWSNNSKPVIRNNNNKPNYNNSRPSFNNTTKPNNNTKPSISTKRGGKNFKK